MFLIRFSRIAVSQDKAAESDSYDIAYLLPFLAGQLRLTYQESRSPSQSLQLLEYASAPSSTADHETRSVASGHGVASQTLGATLNAVMCGGTLEILLLSTACLELSTG